MAMNMSGTRSGADWPQIGEILEVDDDEGVQLCAAGIATPVVKRDVETAVPPKGTVEVRDDQTPPADAEPADADEAEPDELPALREQATALGIKADGRWGADRLRDEIATASKKK
jgi:hypothetical protein